MPDTSASPPHRYPASLEEWWLAQARRYFPGKNNPECLQKLVKPVARLSDRFTIERDTALLKAYESPEAILAYGLFYFPQTFARTRLVLDEMIRFRKWQPADPREVRILDIGCGSGAAAAAAFHALSSHALADRIDLHGVDPSANNLEAARALFKEWDAPGPASLRPRWHKRKLPVAASGPLGIPRGPWDLILLGFSLNELAESAEDAILGDWFLKVLAELGPNGLCLVLEPGVPEASARLMSLRDWLLDTSAIHLWGPCLHCQACPMLAEGKSWCHEVRRWTPPKSLEFLNRKLFRDILHLKWSFLALGRNAPHPIPESPRAFRTVSPVKRTAGKLSLQGCAADGALHTYEWLQRHLSKAEKDFLRSTWERGDIGQASDLDAVGSGLRVMHPPSEVIHYAPDRA